MSKSVSNRFNRIVNDNLPKKLEMLEVLLENPFQAIIFSGSGVGIKSALREFGCVSALKGIYAIIQKENLCTQMNNLSTKYWTKKILFFFHLRNTKT